MRRLSKKQVAAINGAKEAVTEATDKLKEAVESIREEGQEKLQAIRDAVEEFTSWRDDATRDDSEFDEVFMEYQTALGDARDVIDVIAAEAESYYDEKSEKWQEGEKGESYSEWMDRLREISAFEEPERPEIQPLYLGVPDEVEVEFDYDTGEALFDDLPEEPDL